MSSHQVHQPQALRPATPTGAHLVRPSSKPNSRPGTPSRRAGTPSRVVVNMADEFMKHPPNNLNLADPREQDRASDLIGARNTEPVNNDPPSEEEMRRVQEMANRLNK
ncbi:BQ5605_C002g01428 [Microbotryum silenes-dioicae]|uniref:BQ5605_C002g01428 protein n=1 Tax=Microbotryum silenes-dioicae TaxID=796604 RepID=A0A2X0P1L7_9BASI|nr:BQ5605_C002g01428 [Microbotryum silenes-dioicae]